ncbi:MAG: WYL domain-containing protein [Gemmatimonadaceae bacterium]
MPSKLPRLTDLLTTLLARRYPASFEEIARDVPAYADASQAHDARMRMFERDKDELRAFGVPLETVTNDEGEVAGYQIRAQNFYLPYLYLAAGEHAGSTQPKRLNKYGYQSLPQLSFEPDELELIGEAARRAQKLGDPVLSADASSALRKLAFDLPVDATSPSDPHVVTRDHVDERALELLNDALLRRKRVTFRYRGMTRDEDSARSVEPYGLFFLGSHWYLVAHDTEREALRNFRVSRMTDVSVNSSRAQSADYALPENFRLREHARSRQAWELGDGDSVDAEVEFTGESGAGVAAAQLGVPMERSKSRHDATIRRRFGVRRMDSFARWLLSFAGGAVPLSPPELVREYSSQLERTRALYD